jgi:hypothetical protein
MAAMCGFEVVEARIGVFIDQKVRPRPIRLSLEAGVVAPNA